MIRFIHGKLIGKSDRGIVVLVNGVGYEVELPVTTRRAYGAREEGTPAELFISFQQSQNQPTPRLYGFEHQLERDFFEELIRVKDVGPSLALSAISIPVRQIARAIVDQDVKTLQSLKGIGKKTAQQIVAELSDRVAKYALLPEGATSTTEEPVDFKTEAHETLVKQLQYKPQEAERLVEQAMKQDKSISSAEDLFDAVLKLDK